MLTNMALLSALVAHGAVLRAATLVASPGSVVYAVRIPPMHSARTISAMAVWLSCGLSCQAPDGSQLFTPFAGAAGEAGAGGSSDAGAGGTGAGSGAGGSGTGGSGAGANGGSGAVAQGGSAALDAGGDADAVATDSGGGGASDAGSEPGCAGVLVEAVCWYLSANDQSCDQACAARGGVDPEASAIVGTPPQGGSAAQCASVLSALSGGAQVQVTNGNRTDGLGIGCHLFGENDDAWWLTTPAFSTSVAVPEAQIACGCNQ